MKARHSPLFPVFLSLPMFLLVSCERGEDAGRARPYPEGEVEDVMKAPGRTSEKMIEALNQENTRFLAEVTARLAELRKRFDELEERLEGAEGPSQQARALLEKAAARRQSVEARIETIEEADGDATAETKAEIREALDEFEAALNTLASEQSGRF